MTARVSLDDLRFAAEWLGTYDTFEAPEDENGDRAVRLIAWIEAEVARREEEALVRQVRAAQPGATTAQARAALRRVRAERASS